MTDEEQQAAWDAIYQRQPRPWRGAADLKLTDVPRGAKVLELGCGNGKTAAALVEQGFAVTGIDWAETAVMACRQRFGTKAHFCTADVTGILPFPGDSFSAVTAVHLFEHLDDGQAARAAAEIHRVLVPGGRLFLRSFAVGDMRDNGRTAAERDGIRYIYRTEDEYRALFPAFATEQLFLMREPTQFGTYRVWVDGVFHRPLGQFIF